MRRLFRDAEPMTRHRIVQALFDRVEVLGPSEAWLYPSVESEARGWGAMMEGTASADGMVLHLVHPNRAYGLGRSAAS